MAVLFVLNEAYLWKAGHVDVSFLFLLWTYFNQVILSWDKTLASLAF